MLITFHCEHCDNDWVIPLQSDNDKEIMALVMECVTAKCPVCGRQCKPENKNDEN